jgi:predicted aspartyl protease
MLIGSVDDDGLPVIPYTVAGRSCPAIIDTGFSSDLELPDSLRGAFPERPYGPILFLLAGGQGVIQEAYTVDFPFDGQVVQAVATFASRLDILIGTGLLRRYRVTIDFVARTVRLDRLVP